MKKILLGFLIALNLNGHAQTKEGEFIISGGVGYGLINTLYKAVNDVNTKGPFNGMVDICIKPNFSAGLAYTFNEFDYQDTWERDTFSLDVNVLARRTNVGARFLYHIPMTSEESLEFSKVDAFVGLRVGFSIWDYTFDGALEEDRYSKTIPFKFNLPSFQAIVGCRYYITSLLGIHAEMGIGTAPYFVAAGLSFRFNRT